MGGTRTPVGFAKTARISYLIARHRHHAAIAERLGFVAPMRMFRGSYLAHAAAEPAKGLHNFLHRRDALGKAALQTGAPKGLGRRSTRSWRHAFSIGVDTVGTWLAPVA